MRKILIALIIFIFSCSFLYGAAFQNGSFEANSGAFVDGGSGTDELSTAEQDLTGWTIENISSANSLDWKTSTTNGFALTGGGSYKIEFAGNAASQMRIYQIFDTVAGQDYQITYYLYGRSTATATNRQVAIAIKDQNASGTTLNSRTAAPSGDDTWHRYIISFTASSSSTYLSFNNTSSASQGSFLDLITVDMLPELSDSSVTYVYDIGYEDLKAVPRNDMVFMYSLENSGGSSDNDSIVMKFNIPSTLAFKLDSFTFVDGEIVGSLGYDPMYDAYTPIKKIEFYTMI